MSREPPCCHAGQAQSLFHGVRRGDHYMPLQRLTLDHMSCFAIGFPLLGTTEYPQTPFAVAKVSPYWVQ
jgi:hypothetical protein